MQPIIAWIMAHIVVMAALAVACMDLLFALVPTWEANGILHFIYLWLKGLVVPAAK